MFRITPHIFLCGLLFSYAFPAFAHCGSFGSDAVPGTNSSWINLTTEHASFEFGDVRGNWFTMTPSAEYAPLTWLSFAGRLPMAQLRFHDKEEHKSGIGDLEVATRFQLVQSSDENFGLVTGVSLEAPTGSTDDGLGGGHYALTPFVESSLQIADDLHIYLIGRYSEAITEGEHTFGNVHGSLLSPHSSRETAGRFGITWQRNFGFVRGGGEAVYGIDHPKEMGPVLAHFDLGIRLDNQFLLIAGSSMPVAGEPRFLWQTRLGLRYSFDGSFVTETNESSCGCGS